jgi:hypothetical protein
MDPDYVISKIKQNSSDMNEIILAPCDAGYVQSQRALGIGMTINPSLPLQQFVTYNFNLIFNFNIF